MCNFHSWPLDVSNNLSGYFIWNLALVTWCFTPWWGVYLPPIYMYCIRSRNNTDLVHQYARPLCLIDWGVYLHPIYYMHCTRYSNQTHLVYWYARPLCSNDKGDLSASNISHSYIYIKCDGMQGICSQLTMGVSICLLYICIVLEIAISLDVRHMWNCHSLDLQLSVQYVKLPFLTTKCQLICEITILDH